MENINENIENDNINENNDNKKVESEIENIIIFCSCPFTNVILLFYYFYSFVIIVSNRNTCNETDIWIYNLLSYIFILITNYYVIHLLLGNKIFFEFTYQNINLIIYILYLFFTIWGFNELQKVKECQDIKINEVLIISYFSVILQFIVLIILSLTFIVKIFIKKNENKNKIVPINNNTPQIVV